MSHARHLRILASLSAFSLLFGASARAETSTSGNGALSVALELENAFASVAERVAPSVVGVRSFVLRPAGRPKPDGGWREGRKDRMGLRSLGSGSGFVVSDDGYVLSVRHILVDPQTGKLADEIRVEMPTGELEPAELVAADPTLDLSVLKIDATAPLHPATLGDSDLVRVGQWAIALGNPDGADRTFVVGTVASRPDRECYQDELSATLVHLALTLPPESYGGPLVNIRGEVVGISRPREPLQIAPRGSEYALPLKLAMTIYEPLKVRRSRDSPWLGISVLDAPRDWKESRKQRGLPAYGIQIDNVFDPSPASGVGVRVGDVLSGMGGEPVVSVPQFQERLYLYGIGKEVELELWRGDETIRETVTIERRPDSATTR